MGLEKKVPDDIYIGFFEEGSRLNRSYTKDTDEKIRLLKDTFPRACSEVYWMNNYKVGVMFNNFMDTARSVAYENITPGKLAHLATVALMPFPELQDGKKPTLKEMRKRLADLKKLSYPVKKGAGELKRKDAEEYLGLVVEEIKAKMGNEDAKGLDGIIKRYGSL